MSEKLGHRIVDMFMILTSGEHADVFEIQQRLQEAFPPQRPCDRRLLQVIWDNHLSENGDIRREVFIRLKALHAGFDSYTWRIIHLAREKRPFGIRVKRDDELIPFNLVINEEKHVTEVVVNLLPLKKDEETFFSIEYYENSHAKQISRGLFSTKWQYDWAYRFFSPTDYFEKRVYLPRRARVDLEKIRTTLSRDENIFQHGDRILYISAVRQPDPGPTSGRVPYSIPSPTLPATISLVAGLILAVPLSFLKTFAWLEAAATILILSLGVYTSHWIMERLQ